MSDFKKIVEVVKNKASLKQQIYRNTLKAFEELKKAAQQIVVDLEKEANQFDSAVIIDFKEKGAFEFQINLGGDIILYQMHTNVFAFDQGHSLFKTVYVKENPNRSYCGMINVFNFLADSLKYNRFDDSGYLIGRLFINAEDHFFLEGKRQLNFIHNQFVNQEINSEDLRNIVQQTILYSMDFDLFVPPYNSVREISVGQLLHEASGMRQKTGKRLGYKFSFEE